MRASALTIIIVAAIASGCASPDQRESIIAAGTRYSEAVIQVEQARQEAKAAEAKAAEAAAEKAAAEAAEAAARRKAEQASGTLSGSQQFLWKPVSESDGRLVILLPAAIEADECLVGHVPGALRSGRTNGNRLHFRYPKSGAAYGQNVKVTAKLDGDVVGQWTIPDGGARKEY